MPHVAVDEKSYRKNRHFVTLLMDLDRGCIYGTTPGNSRISLVSLLKSLTKTQRNSIEAIAMDMHEPYRSAVEEVFPIPRPAIVHDHFHVVAQMNKALNDVRIDEARELANDGRRDLVGWPACTRSVSSASTASTVPLTCGVTCTIGAAT